MTDVADVPNACERQLSFLVERHGFAPPVTERIGRAIRNGVARTRRRIRPSTKFNPNDRTQLEAYFREVSTQLAREEESWVAT